MSDVNICMFERARTWNKIWISHVTAPKRNTGARTPSGPCSRPFAPEIFDLCRSWQRWRRRPDCDFTYLDVYAGICGGVARHGQMSVMAMAVVDRGVILAASAVIIDAVIRDNCVSNQLLILPYTDLFGSWYSKFFRFFPQSWPTPSSTLPRTWDVLLS